MDLPNFFEDGRRERGFGIMEDMAVSAADGDYGLAILPQAILPHEITEGVHCIEDIWAELRLCASRTISGLLLHSNVTSLP